ncbi:MAG: GNAT family N-acetyltransferase [Bacillota bacterium]
MIIAETKRLRLRLLGKEDIDDLMEIWGDSETMKYCGGAGTRDQEIRSLNYYINQQEERGFSPYAVELKGNGELIGVCGFNPPTKECDAELMYHFKRSYWSNGYASEAVKGCLHYAKDNAPIKVVGALVDKENPASAKVLAKSGFQFMGMEWCDDTKQEEEYYSKELE